MRNVGHATLTAEFEVAGNFRDVEQHVFEVAGDGDLLDGIGELSAGDPQSAGAAREVASDEVHAEAHQLGNVETLFHVADKLLGLAGAGFRKKLPTPMPGVPASPREALPVVASSSFFAV